MESGILNSQPLRPVANDPTGPAGAAAAPLSRASARAIALLVLWVRRSRQRAVLRALQGREARFFQDIGIPRATVYNEGRKWFWQA